jgi:4'-phosphopantetheinyl transferase
MNVYWLEQTVDDVPTKNNWMSAREIAVLSQLRVPKRRSDWRLGRWTAKQALARWFDLPAHARVLARLEVHPAPNGAPEAFCDGYPAPVAISLSHSAGRALCCIGSPGAELGCDLEFIEARSELFVSDYFCTEEQCLVLNLPQSASSAVTTLLWSAKESALKALTVGLQVDTTSVHVSLDDSSLDTNGWKPLEVRCEGRAFHGWGQFSGGWVRTVVGEPYPRLPIRLETHTGGSRGVCELVCSQAA